MSAWLEILEHQVKAKSVRQVARETGLSPTTISLVLRGKYGASTDRIEERVMKIYRQGNEIDCPADGWITPLQCADFYERAVQFGRRATGNPATLRRLKQCLNCRVRKV